MKKVSEASHKRDSPAPGDPHGSERKASHDCHKTVDTIKDWFLKISMEERTMALIIQDKEFLSFLLNSHRSKRSLQFATSRAKTNGGGKVEPTESLWERRFSMAEASEILKGCGAGGSATAIATPITSTPDEPTAEKSVADDDDTKQRGGESIASRTSTKDGDNEGLRIRVDGEIEVSRIDDATTGLVGTENPDLDASKITRSVNHTILDKAFVEAVPEKLCVVFPALITRIKNNGGANFAEVSETPILLLDPAFVENVAKSILADDGKRSEDSDLDVRSLWKKLVDEKSSCYPDKGIPFSVLVSTRVEAALLKAYSAVGSSKVGESTEFGAQKVSEDNNEHWETPPEEMETVMVLGSKSIYSTPQSDSSSRDQGVDEKKSLETIHQAIHHLNNEFQMHPGLDERIQTSFVRMLVEFTAQSTASMVNNDFNVVKESFGESVVDQVKESLPLVPLVSVLQTLQDDNVQGHLEAWNETIFSLLSGMHASDQGESLESKDAKTPSGSEEGKAQVDEAKVMQPSATSLKKNKRKKKRGRKRKGAGASAAATPTAEVAKGQPTALEVNEEKRRVEPTNQPPANDEELVNKVKISDTKQVEKPLVEERKTEKEIIEDDDETVSTVAGIDAKPSVESDQIGSNAVLSQEKDREKPRNTDDGAVRIFRVEGVGATCVVVPGTQGQLDYQRNSTKGENSGDSADQGDDDEWETVEVKSRSSRKRTNDNRNTATGRSNNNGNQRRVKSGRNAARKRNANRKMVREILSSVLDSVDVEVRRRRKQEKLRRVNAPQRSTALTSNASSSSSEPSKPATLRDIVIGRNLHTVAQAGTAKAAPTNAVSQNDPVKKMQEGQKQQSPAIADQNTASTVPETLSGTSNTQSSLATEDVISDVRVSHVHSEEAPVNETCSVEADADVTAPARDKSTEVGAKDRSPAPPLQTLLGPGNTNSATSSVASSLEAPHTSSRRHHHYSSAPENDVGYHLLDICNRLTKDMNMFMERREHALERRRRERGALLGALQETVSKLWGGSCEVKMYGSCATQLDLPSSDVDAVICGLDGKQLRMEGREHRSRSDSDISTATNGLVMSALPYGRQFPLTQNGERVMMLQAELEKLPWAVQVKAIPTASVPVLKILADPSRLPGVVTSVGSEWIMHQHVASPSGGRGLPDLSTSTEQRSYSNPSGTHSVSPNSPGHYVQQHSSPPWRGADVMNGLFSLDITFEGPEHGGLGSTKFSEEVVEKFCLTTGLSRKKTPFVQALMVLKELLAQRRLNEPFTGGLSSYALLLLVVAVTKEREIIKAEMERIERQRRSVASGNGVVSKETTPPRDNDIESSEVKTAHDDKPPVKQIESSQKTTTAPSMGRTQGNIGPGTHDTTHAKRSPKIASERKGASPTPLPKSQMKTQTKVRVGSGSSWASIASMRSKSAVSAVSTMARHSAPPKPVQKAQSPKKSSFAEAVSGKSTSKVPTPKKTGDSAVPTEARSQITKQQPKLQVRKVNKNDPMPSSSGRVTKLQQDKSLEDTAVEGTEQETKSPNDASLTQGSFLFPQGSNDVLEVLCSGETTPGKLLMHFLLYYGEHFDSNTTAVDVSGNHHAEFRTNGPNSDQPLSPYVPKISKGTIDPITGMLTVDPIVIYDAIPGREASNVARSCFAWVNIRWHFSHCYMTLCSAVERSGTPPTTTASEPVPSNAKTTESSVVSSKSEATNMVSPILEQLLSF